MNEREELRCRTVEAGENEGQKREGKPEKTEGRASDKMGTMPMNPLLLSMALPMMVSMLVQALYNIVDSVFVSMINEEALTAVSLAFPIQSLMIAVGAETGVGINAVLSRSLGEKDQESADKAAKNGIFLAILSCILFMIVGLAIARPFYLSQTDDPEIVSYGISYLTIVCALSIGMFFQMTFEKLLQSTGRTMYTMFTQGTGAILNIIFDPIMIFGLFGFPKMGVAAAAAATVFGQIVAAILAIIFNVKINKDIHIGFRGFRPDVRMIATIYRVGIPSIIMQAIGSVMTYGMNLILIQFTSTATAVFGVYYKVQSFVFMPVFGLNSGTMPIMSYNFGARKLERVRKTFLVMLSVSMGVTTLVVAAVEIAPQLFLGLFSSEAEIISMGMSPLRIYLLGYFFMGAQNACQQTFLGLGEAKLSMFIALLRKVILLLPLSFIIPGIFGALGASQLVGLYVAEPVSDCISASTCTILFFAIEWKKLKPSPKTAK